MKIYTKVVISLATLEVTDSVYEEYHGPVAYCGGGSGSSKDSIDKNYNAGMLALSQEQQTWAREMFNMFKYGVTYDPTEKVGTSAAQIVNPEWTAWSNNSNVFKRGPEPPKMIDNPNISSTTLGEQNGYDPSQISEMDLMTQYFGAQSRTMPYEEAATQAGLTLEQKTAEAQVGLIPSQTEAAKAALGLQTAQATSATSLVPLQTETAKLGLEQQKQVLTERSPVISQLYKDALSGVDINKRVSEARAGVQQAYAGAETGMTRNLARYGMAPNESDFRNLEIAKAKGMTGAEGDVRREADTENFQRKVTALGLNF